MTITLPLAQRVLTAERYFALGNDESLRNLELQEGNLVVSSSPTVRHMRACLGLVRQLDERLPGDVQVLFEIDLDLQLAPPDGPGTVRKPDILVLARSVADRLASEDGYPRANAALLVVEIVSRGSQRTDKVIKRAEYADAGIPHYWIVELEPSVQLTACRLENGTYVDNGPAVGTYSTAEPFPLRLDLAALV